MSHPERKPEPDEPLWMGFLKLVGMFFGILVLTVIVFTIRDFIMLS